MSIENQIVEQEIVKTQTFFKVCKVNPLEYERESFIEQYRDQPDVLIAAGLMEA